MMVMMPGSGLIQCHAAFLERSEEPKHLKINMTDMRATLAAPILLRRPFGRVSGRVFFQQERQNGAPCVTVESQGPQKCKKGTRRSLKVLARHDNATMCKKHTQAHIDTNSKHQCDKQTQESTISQTRRTNTHTNEHTNNKTASIELQTQTQTPAGWCSPKAT